jgi:hypothetical protein
MRLTAVAVTEDGGGGGAELRGEKRRSMRASVECVRGDGSRGATRERRNDGARAAEPPRAAAAHATRNMLKE